MHNTHTTSLFKTWVKNVYSLWLTSGDTCGYIYTAITPLVQSTHIIRVQLPLYTQLTTSFTPSLFTAFFRNFNLLIHHLYPLSTAPTIKYKEIN